MQLVEDGEKLLVRIFVSSEVFHEYSLPLNTTLAQDLLTVARMYSAGRCSLAAAAALMARGSSAGQSTVSRESYLVRIVMGDS